MPLTELEAKYAKRRDRSYKLADGGGLFLLIQPNGSKLWRMKYRYGGKEKLLSFGAYPTLGITAAREKRDAAKALLAEGKDPGQNRSEMSPEKGQTFLRCPALACQSGFRTRSCPRTAGLVAAGARCLPAFRRQVNA